MKYSYKSLGHEEIVKEKAEFEAACQTVYLWNPGFSALWRLHEKSTEQAGCPVYENFLTHHLWLMWLYQAEEHKNEARCLRFEAMCSGLVFACDNGGELPEGLFRKLADAHGLTFDEWEYIKSHIGTDCLQGDALEEIEAYIKGEGSEQRWISVNERMPGAGQVVLAYGDLEGVEMLTAGENDLPEDVTHWMPLPKPPKRE